MFTTIARNALVALGTIAATSLTIAGTAHAETRQAQVKTVGLDLSSAEGSAMLQARISRAASMVCNVDGERDLTTMASAQACRKAAIAGTARQVASLNAAHDARYAENTVVVRTGR